MKLDEFRSLFEAAQHRMFRYEGLPEYEMSDDDRQTVERWRSGDSPPDHIKATPWQDRVRMLTSGGRTMQRVRLLRPPFTDYLSMSVEWWYPHNIAAGEQTLGLDPAEVTDLPEHDFWIFDDSNVAVMHYSDDGVLSHIEAAPASEVETYVRQREQMLRAAEPLSTVYQRLLADA